MIEQLKSGADEILGFKLSGKLHDADYKTFVPAVDAAVTKHGKVRILAQFHDFQGWDMKALWDDIKFSTTHCTKIDRIALVGEKKWEEWMGSKELSFSSIPYTFSMHSFRGPIHVRGMWRRKFYLFLGDKE